MKWKISNWMENIKLRLLSQVPLHTNCRWSTNKNAGWQNVRCYIRRHRWVSERTRHWTNIKHAEPPLGWNILLFLLRTTDSFHPTSGRSAHIAAARLRIEMSENRKFLNEKNRAEFSPQRLMTFLFSKTFTKRYDSKRKVLQFSKRQTVLKLQIPQTISNNPFRLHQQILRSIKLHSKV